MKKIFIYFCLFFSIFSLHAPQGHETYQVIFFTITKRFQVLQASLLWSYRGVSPTPLGIRDFPIILQGYASNSHKATLHIRARLRFRFAQGYAS